MPLDSEVRVDFEEQKTGEILYIASLGRSRLQNVLPPQAMRLQCLSLNAGICSTVTPIHATTYAGTGLQYVQDHIVHCHKWSDIEHMRKHYLL